MVRRVAEAEAVAGVVVARTCVVAMAGRRITEVELRSRMMGNGQARCFLPRAPQAASVWLILMRKNVNTVANSIQIVVVIVIE